MVGAKSISIRSSIGIDGGPLLIKIGALDDLFDDLYTLLLVKLAASWCCCVMLDNGAVCIVPRYRSERATLAFDPTENARARALCSEASKSTRSFRLLCSNLLPTEYARMGRSESRLGVKCLMLR